MQKAHLICHTHWDREWYMTRMQFRPRLVRLVDGLLALAENSVDYVSFMLDGQTIALEDYLEVKPYNRARLQKAIDAGKILIGPWYILPDELLISGESHIRNYLVGDAIASGYGHKMNLGYLPDSFGHPAQMPQLLRGLGMDTTIFWRGASNEMDRTEFFWTAPDGESQVLCVNMPLGYSTAARLGEDLDRAVGQLTLAMDLLAEKGSTDILLLMNGSDHLLADRHVPEILAHFNSTVKNKEIVFSTLEDFLADLRAHLPDDVKNFTGNLCYGDKTILLGGTLSTRMYLKQANHSVQKKLERYIEPIHALEKLSGGAFDFGGYQQYLWKLVLENHPHDSICGCSVDSLHDEMMTRFASLAQLEDTMLEDACLRFQSTETAKEPELFLFEPTQDALPQYLEVEVAFDSLLKHTMNYPVSTTKELPGKLPEPPRAVRVTDEAGRVIPAVVLSSHADDYDLRFADYDQPTVWHANKLRVALLLPGFSYGAHTLRFCRDDDIAAEDPAPVLAENAYYSVRFDRQDGAFVVIHKPTGKQHTGVHRFVDVGDAGDEYTYSWPDHDRLYSLESQNITGIRVETVAGLCSSVIVEGLLRLPASLTADRSARCDQLVDCPFTVKATVYEGVNRIDFKTSIDNRAMDHRIQVEFPVGTLCTHSSGSAAFGVTQHPIERVIPAHWEEYPLFTALNHGFVDVGDGTYGVSLASCGMTEYEAANRDGQSFLRLTLLRCVGWLSLPGLNTRSINGGWQCETPGAQCLGSYDFSYSICYHQDSWQKSGTYAMADRALHPAYVKQAFCKLDIGNPLAFVSGLPPLLRLSAMKPAEDGKSVLLRFYSLDPQTQQVTLTLPDCVRTVEETSLAEQTIAELPIAANGTLVLPVKYGKIVTVRLIAK